jgi:hypothetical protein
VPGNSELSAVGEADDVNFTLGLPRSRQQLEDGIGVKALCGSARASALRRGNAGGSSA